MADEERLKALEESVAELAEAIRRLADKMEQPQGAGTPINIDWHQLSYAAGQAVSRLRHQ
jgi:hypothetical protein